MTVSKDDRNGLVSLLEIFACRFEISELASIMILSIALLKWEYLFVRFLHKCCWYRLSRSASVMFIVKCCTSLERSGMSRK